MVNFMKKTTFLCLTAVLLIVQLPTEVYATSTQEQYNQALKDKEATKDKLGDAQENMENLEGEITDLQSYLTNLNDELNTASSELAEIESLISEKTLQIETTTKELEVAEVSEKKQYKEMKERIKFMYERGESAYIELFFSANDFSELLNMQEYVSKLTAYDRKMLESYTQLKKDIEEKKEFLNQEKSGLETLQGTAVAKKEEFSKLVETTANNVSAYADQISAQEQQMMEFEKQLAQKEDSVATLQIKLQEEMELSKKSAESVHRDLSEIGFVGGDLDLMAALIECEAGGESYVGKVAVGAVVLNRVKSPVFPDTIVGVIYAPSQFSPVASGRLAVVLARGANESCYEAAQEAMAGSSPVGDRVFFRTPIPGLVGMQIGGHIFY